jgi:DNA polymerase III subunit delta'
VSLQFDPMSSQWPVVGHERAVSVLRNAITRGMVAHAYMFTGPNGVGKRTLALAFAMTLNCQSEPPEGQGVPDIPCGLCASCSRILRGEHPDVIEVNLETQAALAEDAGKGKSTPAKELKIDTVREMQRTVGLSPYMGRYKVFVIGDADKLNEEASNALLKTLEEPPSQTVLILLAPDASSVLPTISSRCVQVPLRPLRKAEVARALESQWGAEPEQAERLAALASGRLGWAVTMLRERGRLENRGKALEEMALLSGGTVTERVNAATRYAKQFTDSRQELYAALDTWEGWWRDLVVVNTGATDLVMNVDQLPALQSLARRIDASKAYEAIVLIQQTRQQLAENVNPRLALESLTLNLP